MNPQSVTIGVRLGRKLNAVIIAAAQPAPDRVAFCGGVLASIAGAIGGLVGPQTAAELLRISLARLEEQPQLELPPGTRLAIAAASEGEDLATLSEVRSAAAAEAAETLREEAALIFESNSIGGRSEEWAEDTTEEQARHARYIALAEALVTP